MKIEVIGHSTVLIETNSCKILTDPYFGINGNLMFERTDEISKGKEELKNVDVVLLSHSHWDHIDRKFFNMLDLKTTIIMPNHLSKFKKILGIKQATALKPWNSISICGVKITRVPAIHMAITAGYIIEADNKTVYFAADTLYGDFMKKLGGEYKIDVALMPVTCPKIPVTMNNGQAVKATKALKPKIIIPIHQGIKPRLPFLRGKETVDTFKKSIEENKLKSIVMTLVNGSEYTL